MERKFVVEAKDFFFWAKFGLSQFHWEEKMKSFLGVVVLGSLCSAWLVATRKEALKSPGVENFVKSFREDSKVLIVQRGGNRAGRFLEMASFAIGGRKGFIWFLEGREGQGWRRVAGELSKMVAFLESASGSMVAVEGSLEEELQNSSNGHSFGVSPEKGGVVSSYTEVVCGAIGFSFKIPATPMPMAEMHKLDLLPMSLFRDEEDLRVAVNCFDLEEKSPRLMEKKQEIQSHGGDKVRKMKLEYPRFWNKFLELLRSNLDRVSTTVAQFFGLGLKPKLSLGVKSAQVGFKPILKKARGTAGRELSSVVSESSLGSGTVSNPGPDAVSDPDSDPGTDSLPFHFPITSMASSAAVQEKIR